MTKKLPNPFRETQVPELVFITIPCLKFWALMFSNLGGEFEDSLFKLSP